MIPLRHAARFSFSALLLTGTILLTSLLGCSGEDPPADLPTDMATSTADLAPAAPRYNIHATIALKEDAQGVGVLAQNGVIAHIPKAKIVGKSIAWIILKGGEQIANGKMLEIGSGMIDDNLRAELTTKGGYPNGPYELALLILLETTDPAKAPTPGDLAAFDLTKPPTGEPPITGTSVRVNVHGADASVTLINRYFIKL